MKDNAYEISVLQSYINRTLDDTASPLITKGTVFGYGDIRDHVLDWLKDLEAKRILRFVADPYTISDDDVLLEMKSYIGLKSSILGFLNWR